MLEILQRHLLPRPLHAGIVYRLATTVQGEGSVFRHLKEFRRLQHQSEGDVRRRQDQKLAQLLNLRARSPYYLERDGEIGAVRPESARARLLELPFLTKRDIQRGSGKILVQPLEGRRIRKSTGGSTGEPVAIIKSANGVAQEMAASWMALEWSGIRIGDRCVRFWGTPLTRQRRVRFALTDFAMNRIRLSAFNLDDEDLERYWARCIRFRPIWFYGYASLIHLFGEWIERTGRDGRALGLKTIVPTSEPLTDGQRDDLRRIFGARIQNEYGCGEVGAMAYECDHGRLHLVTDTTLVEVITPEGRQASPGDTGEIVVTDLVNTSMPLIRYRMGDQAVLGDLCNCGRPTPTLERVWGRVHDVVYTPAGRRWHGEKIDYLMATLYQETAAFRQYQVVQLGSNLLTIRLVADAPIPNVVAARIATYVADRLDGMQVTVVRVAKTERSPSGKLRLVRNDWLTHGGVDEASPAELR